MARTAARRPAEADGPTQTVTGEAEPPVETDEPRQVEAAPTVPEGVARFDPVAPKNVNENIVTVVPTSNAVVTVPSGASFQLQPGVALQMQKRDAEFLSESGFA